MNDLHAELRPRTAHQFVHQTLRRAILRGALPAGTRLVQADVAEQLQVSTTPIREALRDLAAEGLIHLDAHRGAVVKGLDVEEAHEIYELRQMLEPVSIRKTAEQVTEEVLDEAQALQDRMDAEEDAARWVELNREFHALLADAANSPHLSRILAGLRDASTVYVGMSITASPEHRERGNAEHHGILRACRDRDPEAAATATMRHLESTRRAIDVGLEQARLASPDGQTRLDVALGREA